MPNMKVFLKEQGPNILTVVVVFITLLGLFAILGVNFDPVVDKHVEKVVTIESFGPSSRAESACDKYHSDPMKIDSWCQTLSKKGWFPHQLYLLQIIFFTVLLIKQTTIGI